MFVNSTNRKSAITVSSTVTRFGVEVLSFDHSKLFVENLVGKMYTTVTKFTMNPCMLVQKGNVVVAAT